MYQQKYFPDNKGMMKEAEELPCECPKYHHKSPMTPDGLETVAALYLKGIKTNITLIFSANQALLAARAGAAYVSPFLGRLDDIGHDGLQVVSDIADIFAIHDIQTEISRRLFVTQCILPKQP